MKNKITVTESGFNVSIDEHVGGEITVHFNLSPKAAREMVALIESDLKASPQERVEFYYDLSKDEATSWERKKRK